MGLEPTKLYTLDRALLYHQLHVHVGLLDLADSYCEKQLKRTCERLLWQSVSIDNVTSLIAVAYKYKAEVRKSIYSQSMIWRVYI